MANTNSNDLFWYVIIALAIVVAIALSAVYFPVHLNRDYTNWAEFALLTIVVFGYLEKWYWHSRKSARFWMTYSSLLVCHSLVLVPVFSRVGRLPILLFGAFGAVEAMTLTFVVFLVIGKRKGGLPRI